jgi:hypothetical protein
MGVFEFKYVDIPVKILEALPTIAFVVKPQIAKPIPMYIKKPMNSTENNFDQMNAVIAKVPTCDRISQNTPR